MASIKEVLMKRFLQEALRDFRWALVDQGVYHENHQNLERAYNRARDFVDFLVDGPEVLEKGRRRFKSE